MTPSTRDRARHVAAGVLIPIGCFAADPIVFRSGWSSIGEPPLLQGIAVFAYAILPLALTAMIVDLIWEPRSALLGGVLGAASAVALALALLLLPFSVLGILMAGIGFLGFLPFLSAWSYLLRSRAVWRRSPGTATPERRAALWYAGFVLTIGVPIAAQWAVTNFVERAVADVVRGDDSGLERLARLRVVSSVVDARPFFVAYNDLGNAALRPSLEKAYDALTGESLRRTLATAD